MQLEMPNVMNISVSHIRRALQESYSAQEAANLSRIVCCEMLGQTAVDYYLGKDIILSPKEMQNLDSILTRLHNFEPIQYIQGTARFLERTYHVAPGVLIPRPETEELVEVMLKEVPSDARILDIGTGSGCIAVSLSKAFPDAEVEAWDISDEALTIARRNNDMLGGNVRFLRQNILTYAPDGKEHYDVIVSNPPYVTESEKQAMERNVLDWEPFRHCLFRIMIRCFFIVGLQNRARRCLCPAAVSILKSTGLTEKLRRPCFVNRGMPA